MVDDDAGLSSKVTAEVVVFLDYVFARETLWKTGGGSFFSANKRSVIATALQCLPRIFQTSGAGFAHLTRNLVEDL